MFKSILVPIDLADTDLAKPAIGTAATLSQTWHGMVRLLNVLPMTPVMLAEYVPADFDTHPRQTPEEADLFPGLQRRPRRALCQMLGARGAALRVLAQGSGRVQAAAFFQAAE